MFYSASYSPKSDFLSRLQDYLRILLPNLALSFIISIVGSIALTGLSYWLSSVFGIPTMPFFFIMF